MATYDVFLSYRRDEGAETARLLRLALAQRGYRVFLDVEDLSSGQFDERLLDSIEEASHFIVILSPHALERAGDTQDWLRRELEHAVTSGRNVIPMIMRGFEFPPSAELPDGLRRLPQLNAVVYSHEYFDATVARLVQYMPGEAPEGTPDRFARSARASSAAAPQSPQTAEAYGAFLAESATGYIVFGLLTAWAYVALRLGGALVRHVESRQRHFETRAAESGLRDQAMAGDSFQSLAQRAFYVNARMPRAFAASFVGAALFTLGIFAYFIFISSSHLLTPTPVALLAVASSCFYLLLVTFVLWLRSTLKRHDRYERLVVRWFDDARVGITTLPSNDFATRWDRIDQHIALFLVVGLPVTFSPTASAWYVLIKQAVPLGAMMFPVSILVVAGLYHLWGVRVLLDAYRSHLLAERQ